MENEPSSTLLSLPLSLDLKLIDPSRLFLESTVEKRRHCLPDNDLGLLLLNVLVEGRTVGQHGSSILSLSLSRSSPFTPWTRRRGVRVEDLSGFG